MPLKPFLSRFFGRTKEAEPEERYKALNDLDRKLERWLDFDHGFFVEAGANDGIAQSNTWYYENHRNWRGLLVEPIPELARRARENRPNSIVENCALGSFERDGTTLGMTYCNLMSVVKGGMHSAEGEHAHLETGRAVQQIDSYELEVPCRALDSILREHGVARIDFMSLDVEGFELDVLKGMDFRRLRPRYLLVEARYPDEIREFLKEFYNEVEILSHHDILFSEKA